MNWRLAGPLTACSLLLLGTCTASAQDAPSASRAALDAQYREASLKLDRGHILALSRLAAGQKGAEADRTYADIFRFAIAGEHFKEAEPAAKAYLATAAPGSETGVLARLVQLNAEADRGDYESSQKTLKAALSAASAQVPAKLQSQTILALAEAHFRRLIRAHKFDLARELCDLVAAAPTADPVLKDHFATFKHRIALIGKPAPALAGTDVDGAKVSLADLKGKAVLVVFWATWCPPCAESFPILEDALNRYGKEGFTVLGVNLDSGPDAPKTVRRFLVEYGAAFPNILAGTTEGTPKAAADFHVKEIPASVLVGPDGTVVTIDLAAEDLPAAITRALGKTR